MILNSPEIFNYLSHEIVAHLRRNCTYEESNKKIFANSNTKEIALFFKLDGGYLPRQSGGKKADILVYYCNLEEKDHVLMVIELKGENIEYAIKQLEETIKDPRFSDFWNNFDGTKLAGIVTSKASPSKRKKDDIEHQFYRHNKVHLTTLHRSKANIKDFLKKR